MIGRQRHHARIPYPRLLSRAGFSATDASARRTCLSLTIAAAKRRLSLWLRRDRRIDPLIDKEPAAGKFARS
jgi:hypothetical protein